MANQTFQGLFSPLEVVSTNNLLKIEQDQCKITLSRIYYSSVFKIYYFSLMILSLICIIGNIYFLSYIANLIFLLEITLTIMITFEVFYKVFMQGCLEYIKQFWNIIDTLICLSSVCLLWYGYSIGKSIGEIDSNSAILAIIARTIIQIIQLFRAVKHKNEQDVQIIDLNGISEGDEAPQHTEKNLRGQKLNTNNKLEEKNKVYEVSVVEDT